MHAKNIYIINKKKDTCHQADPQTAVADPLCHVSFKVFSSKPFKGKFAI